MERKFNQELLNFVLRDLLTATHALRRIDIDSSDNKRLFKQFVNDLFLDSRIVAEIEEMQKLLAEIDAD